MSQVFHFIHFLPGAPAKYGFTEQKLTSLHATVVENDSPRRSSKNGRDEVWVIHSSLFTNWNPDVTDLANAVDVTKIIIDDGIPDKADLDLIDFDLIIPESEFLAAEAANPYWLMNQIYALYDQQRRAVLIADAKFANFDGSDQEIERTVNDILEEIGLDGFSYRLSKNSDLDQFELPEGMDHSEYLNDSIRQVLIYPVRAANHIVAQTIGLICNRVLEMIQHNDLATQLETMQEKFSRSQKALIQSEKLSVAGKMTAAIAHEINNPLQGVRNCFHLVSNDKVDPESKEKYLEMTNQELDRLTKTVQRMLEFYRPNEEFQTVQLLDVLEHTLNLLYGQLSENRIQVKSSWPLQVPPIQGIADQIEQVFMNLILNAKDFMVGGGTLWITIEVAKPFITITFEDSGPGVALEYRDRIFEPFVSTKGTAGLGLSVCNEIISNHQGVIELMDDIQDRGARFKIILPMKQRVRKG